MGIVWSGGRVLIGRRPAGVRLAGYWEFPGGKVEPGETPISCVVRELEEELGLAVEVEIPLPPIVHRDRDLTVQLWPFLCQLPAGSPATVPRARVHEALRWVLPRELAEYRFPPANRPLLAQLAMRRA